MPSCPNCGMEVSGTDIFCGHCGANLAEMKAAPSVPEGAVKTLLMQRIEAIKRKDTEAIANLVDKEKYTKFDDWPPFERQSSDALTREADALKVLKEYEYETTDWRIDIFEDAAVASFTINYHGTIRNQGFQVRSRVSALLTKREEAWKLIHEHWSRFPEARMKREGMFRRQRFPW